MPPRDPYRYYRIEARELLDGMVSTLLGQGETPAAEVAAKLLRLAHTLKGAARVVKQTATADLAHQFEEELEVHRNDAAPMPRAKVDGLLALADAMRSELDLLSADAAPAAPVAATAPAPAPVSELAPSPVPAAPAPMAEPAPVASSPLPAGPGEGLGEHRFRSVRVDLEDVDRLIESVSVASVQLEALVRETADLLAHQRAARNLMERGGVTLPPAIAQLVVKAGATGRSLLANAERSVRVLHEVQEQVDAMRLFPASMVFGNLERAVHDAAGLVGKDIQFQARGGEQRLEAHVLKPVADALLHVVRNAVDHGIEAAPARAAAGKPARGRIELSVDRRGGRIAFVARDDGRGIDLEAVRAKARASGRLDAAKAAALDLQGAIDLLVQGGLSTRSQVSALSGRGVGLDTVRDLVAKLKGQLFVRSRPGQGTEVEVIVPVSLSRLPALVVEVAGRTCSLPLTSIVKALRVDEAGLTHTADGTLIRDGAEVLPYARLADLLGEGGTSTGGARSTALVVQGAASRVVLAVDRLVGQSDVLLHPMPAVIGDTPLFQGSSLDAAGDPQMMLDADGLVRAVRAGRGRAPAAVARRLPRILVIDDSLTTRMLEQSILESAGFEVALATSGEEGLAMARREPYDLFISDIEMPGMSGFDFIAATRADPRLKEIPGILVSSLDSPADKLRGAEVGARAFIVKGEFEQGRFLDTIRALVD